MKFVDFANLIFVENTGVLVREAGLRRFEDRAGRTIGVVPGSTNERAIKEQFARRKMSANFVQFRDREEGVHALARGVLDGFASDKLVLLSMAQAIDRRELRLLPEDLSFEPFAIMLPQGDWAFRLAVNAGLARVYRSGEIVEIYNKWFSDLSQRPSVWVGAVYAFGALPD
jgi:glutamate/aspartate transport system substrate-binding protein